MEVLYKALENEGLSRKFVKDKIFPEWWSDEIANKPIGYQQALLIVARNLNLEITGLFSNPIKIIYKDIGKTKIKRV